MLNERGMVKVRPQTFRLPVGSSTTAVVVFSKWEYKAHSLFVDIAPAYSTALLVLKTLNSSMI